MSWRGREGPCKTWLELCTCGYISQFVERYAVTATCIYFEPYASESLFLLIEL